MRTQFLFCFILFASFQLQAQFSEETVLWDNPVSHRADLVLIADFNGDEQPDYVYRSLQIAADFVLLSSPAGLARPVLLDPSYSIKDAVVADYEQDGDLDMLVVGNGLIYIFTNDGEGNFSLEFHLIPVSEAGLYDMDGDGHLDLIGGGNHYSWQRNLGNFSGFQEMIHGHSQHYNEVLLEADFNRDGHKDLLFLDKGGFTATITVLYRNAMDPIEWTYLGQVKRFFNQADPREGLHMVDFDLDGDTDLIVQSKEESNLLTINIIEQVEAGWAEIVKLGEFQQGYTGLNAPQIAIADVNADGLPDIVTNSRLEESMRAWINESDESGIRIAEGEVITKQLSRQHIDLHRNYFDQQNRLLLTCDGPMTHQYEFEAGALSFAGSVIEKPVGSIVNLNLLDANKDQQLDFFVQGANSNRTYLIESDAAVGYTPPSLFADIPTTMTHVADLNNDDTADLIVKDDNANVFVIEGPDYTNPNSGNFVFKDLSNSYFLNVENLDFNVDGNNDLRFGSYLILGSESGVYPSRWLSAAPGQACQGAPVEAFDMNGDLLPDLLFHCMNNSAVYFFRQGAEEELQARNVRQKQGSSQKVVAGHFNQDLLADLLIFQNGNSNLYILLQDEEDFFVSDSIAIGGSSNQFLIDYKSAHLNSDGLSDLVLSSRNTDTGQWQLCYYLNTGAGRFDEGTVLRESSERTRIICADLDQNGLDDIIYLDASGRYLSYFLNLGDAIVTQHNGSVIVHPNPASERINLPLTSSNFPMQYQIFDLSGRELSWGSCRSSIDVSGLSQGFYLLRYSGEGKVYHAKFVKQ